MDHSGLQGAKWKADKVERRRKCNKVVKKNIRFASHESHAYLMHRCIRISADFYTGHHRAKGEAGKDAHGLRADSQAILVGQSLDMLGLLQKNQKTKGRWNHQEPIYGHSHAGVMLVDNIE